METVRAAHRRHKFTWNTPSLTGRVTAPKTCILSLTVDTQFPFRWNIVKIHSSYMSDERLRPTE